MQAIAKALAPGAGPGLPPDLFFDTVANTAVVAPPMRESCQPLRITSTAPQFPLRLLRKRLALILAAVEQPGVPLPSTEAATG
jgi:3-hydroxyisobutyrate dehydrogenase-like beta-hydroxyacid dehydrogenase